MGKADTRPTNFIRQIIGEGHGFRKTCHGSRTSAW